MEVAQALSYDGCCTQMKEREDVSVSPIGLEDLEAVADVHLRSFPEVATTKLGKEVVVRYYEWQFIAPHKAHFLGAWVQGRLGGFCFCGLFRDALRGFLRRNRWFLVGRVLTHPWLLANSDVSTAIGRALRSLCSVCHSELTAPSPGPDASRPFGILSIAVAPESRRLGVGLRLMAEAEAIARREGFQAMGLTVRTDNFAAIHFYEKLGWKRVPQTGAWRGQMTKHLERQDASSWP